MRSVNTSLAIVATATLSLAAISARGQSTAYNTGSLGTAGDGVNSAGVTLGQPSPLAAPGDAAVGYFNPNPGGSGTYHTQVPYNAALNPSSSSSPFTVEFWAEPSVTVTDAPGPCPVFNRVSSGNRSGWIFFQRSPTTGWNFRMYNGVGSNVGVDLSGGTNAANAWSDIVVVWNGTTASLYDNGIFMNSATGIYNPSSSAILSIGTYDDGSNAYNGVVDELAIYGTALSASKILAHYNAASSTTVGAYSSLIKADGALEYLQQLPSPSTLVWSGATNNVWDVNTTANFSGGSTGKFNDGDFATLDSSGSNRSIAVAAGGVSPGSVVFSNSAGKNYSLSGGPIIGSTSLIVSGGGRVTLSGSNTFTGGTEVTSGTLAITSPGALFSGSNLTVGTSGSLFPSATIGSADVVTAVPEPSTLALLGIGAIGLLAMVRRQGKKASLNLRELS